VLGALLKLPCSQTYAIAGGCARSRYATEASQLRRFLSLLPVQQKDKTQIGIYLVPVDLKNRTRLAYELEVGPSSRQCWFTC
jgi:hypothetical protein